MADPTILLHLKTTWVWNSNRAHLGDFSVAHHVDGDNLVGLSQRMTWPAGSKMFSLGILVWIVGRLGSLEFTF